MRPPPHADYAQYFRDAVVETTPALEIELLTLVALNRGRCNLAAVFDRDPAKWRDPAPRWAMVSAESLVAGGFLTRHPASPNTLILTETGAVRIGRRRIPELQP